MTEEVTADGGTSVTIGALIAEATAAIAADPSGLPDAAPRLEAELLLSMATGLERTACFAWPERGVTPGDATRFRALLARRLRGEPIAYIRGYQPFWDLELEVTPAVLIPRPETELLVQTALELGGDRSVLRVADLGTGSGAVAAAVAHERPDWAVLAIERSPAALAVAHRNFHRLGLTRCQAIGADWLAPIGDGALDQILSNPPYVADSDSHLMRGDLRFEPSCALAAGSDGLDAIRAITAGAHRCLRPSGWLALEHGCDQGEAVRTILSGQGFIDPCTRRDLAGLDRVSFARAP